MELASFFAENERELRFRAWASERGLEDKAQRWGEMLVGNVVLEDEPALFQFLCDVEGDMVIEKTH